MAYMPMDTPIFTKEELDQYIKVSYNAGLNEALQKVKEIKVDRFGIWGNDGILYSGWDIAIDQLKERIIKKVVWNHSLHLLQVPGV